MFLSKLSNLHRVTLLLSDVSTCLWVNILLQFLRPWPAGQDWTALIPPVAPLTHPASAVYTTRSHTSSQLLAREILIEGEKLWASVILNGREWRSSCTDTNDPLLQTRAPSYLYFLYPTAITFYPLFYHLLDFYLSNYLIIWARSKVYFWLEKNTVWYVAILINFDYFMFCASWITWNHFHVLL